MSSSSNPLPEGQWSTDFYDCCSDHDNCVKACFLPCVTFGQIAEIIDGGTTTQKYAGTKYCFLWSGFRAWYARGYRQELRKMFNLPEEPHSDCCVHTWCCVCALTQEFRELRNRGADPSLGWQGNMEKWNQEGLKMPPIPVRMAPRCSIG